MKISEDVLVVLSTMQTSGNLAVISEQLDRKRYLRVDEVLAELGGKWNRHQKGHVFAGDAADILDAAIVTGEVTTRADLGFFETPPAIVANLIDLAHIEPGMRVLEPSAGEGAIVRALQGVRCVVSAVEIDKRRAEKVDALNTEPSGAGTVNADFMTLTPTAAFDRVVMNPPFARQQDVDHVCHALGFLVPGGRLVAVMSAGTLFRRNRKAQSFRILLDSLNGTMTRLPEDAFAVSGTNVHTVVVTANRHAAKTEA